MSDIHSCSYFCQIPACVLQQRDTLRDKLQTSESVAAAPQAVEAMSDAYIESLVRRHGGKWGGSYWVFEDADLHPFVRTILTLASHTQAVPQALDVMSDEHYNGEGWELLAMALAAEEHDDIHRLILCGGPIPQPWGEVWEQYEDEAKRMIELVKKHAGPALSSHTAPAEPSVTPVQAWMRVDNVMNVSTGPNAYKDPMRAQVYLATGKEAAPAEPLLSKAAKDIIGQWLNDDMDTAIRNGANSISMPGELVEIAAWLCKVAPAVAVEPDALLVKIHFAAHLRRPFIYDSVGRINLEEFDEITAQAMKNQTEIFTKGGGDYTFKMTYFSGQYGPDGRCEYAPGWEFDFVAFAILTVPEGVKP